MKEATRALFDAFDGHDAVGLRDALRAGADVHSLVDGKSPMEWLLEQYTRSDRLVDCLRWMLDAGATFPEVCWGPVLLNDARGVEKMVRENPEVLKHRVRLKSAFTSLDGVSLLHLAAEYGNAEAVRGLLDVGMEVDNRAERTSEGFNGHTALFHTVNSNGNRSRNVMRMLLEAGARVDVRLEGLYWGRGFEWETLFFDVTPVSYAQMGLMPQVHRDEVAIYENIREMLRFAGRTEPELGNVPNRYLVKG